MGLILNKLDASGTATTEVNNTSGGAPAGGLVSKVQAAQNGSNTQVTPDTLIQSLGKKYNAVSDTLGDFSQGVVKGGLSTIRGIGEVGTKIGDTLSKGVEKLGGPADLFHGSDVYRPSTQIGGQVKDFLEPKNTAESIGKGAEQIGEFFIPAGAINDVEKVLSLGGKAVTVAKLTPFVGETAANMISKAAGLGIKMGVRATETGGVVGIQSGGNQDETKTAAEVGAGIPVAGAIVKPAAEFAGKVLGGFGKRLAGALTGRGTSVIDEVIKDPRAAIEGMTGQSMDVLGKDANAIKEASLNMKAAAGKEYSRVVNNLQEIYDNEMKPKGFTFDKGTEINKVTDLLKEKYGIVKSGEVAQQTGEDVADKGKLDFNSSRFLPKEATIIERALNILKSYRDPLTPKTIESLASKIDKLKSLSPSAIETNSAVHTITTSLRDSVAKMGEQAGYPEGANLARNFATAMDKIDNFNSLFKTTSEDLRPEGAKGTGEVSKVGELRQGSKSPIILPETEKTKIVQDLSTLFSGNKDVDKDVLRKMVFGGQGIISREAGRTLATATEKASTKLGDLIREAVITPIVPPKLIGQIVAHTALSADKVGKFVAATRKLTPFAKGALIELISKNNQ